jgi:hypothetical protein
MKDIAWWYWLVSAVSLTAGVAGWHWGFCIVGTIATVQIVHFTVRTGSLTSFPVQIRLTYLAILIAAAPAAMQWMYWVPTMGTWALVTVGYCPLARMLSLMPWNRQGPLTLARVIFTITAPPEPGNVMHGLSVKDSGCGAACSMEGRFAQQDPMEMRTSF